MPTRLVFSVDRESIEVKVHQRFNVRVLELIHQDGTTISLRARVSTSVSLTGRIAGGASFAGSDAVNPVHC